MTGAVLVASQTPLSATTAVITSDFPSPLSGAVPAQHPARSHPLVATTATPPPSTPAGALASSQNAKPASQSPLNGPNNQNMAQGVSAPANGGHEHAKKPSVVISASGATGYTPNGGPVSQNGGRPPINFGSLDQQDSPVPASSVPYQAQAAALPTPPRDPRVTTPAHSPQPIPQPSASGGRPPSSLQGQSGTAMTFGSMQQEGQQHMPSGQMQPGSMGPGIPMHERRASSQSMVSPAGRGRAYPPQQPYGMPSPGPGYRTLPNQGRTPSNMGPGFQPQMPPGSPYARGRNSPAIAHAQPNMPQQHAQMPYGYPAHMSAQHQGMYNMPHFDPNSGYYQPYYHGYGQYPGQAPSGSPNRYPTPFNVQQNPMQPPFHPPNMSRSASQVSERPPSSLGHAPAPSMPQNQTVGPSPANQQPTIPSTSFVKPSQKKSSAIKITDAQGNPLDFNKPKLTAAQPAPAQQSSPLIVGAASSQTPPPRVPSAQHDRTESKSTKTAEETRNAFQEQVRRKQEEEKRKEEEEAAKALREKESAAPASAPTAAHAEETEKPATIVSTPAPKDSVVSSAVSSSTDNKDEESKNIEEAGAVAATVAVATAAVAATSTAAVSSADETKDEKVEAEKEETEDERMERMIAEMEAAEREEEERENAYKVKQQKEKEESTKLEAERAAKQDEELKRQEREAEERELQREREREQKDKSESNQESKELFGELKKPTLGPGASAPESGTQTPQSEDVEASSMPPPSRSDTPRAGSQKPKPTQLKLDTAKRIEPAEPTPGMQALQSARFLSLKDEPTYPENIKSPNPALNMAGHRRARTYDKEFLIQFQNIFKEKPSIDWEQKVKDTLGPSDEPGSARGQPARTPSSAMGARSVSGRPAQGANFGGAMGHFRGPGDRTLPPGTTSQQRFIASQGGSAMGPLPGQMARVPSQLGMGASMSRTNSLQTMAPLGAQSPRQQSVRNAKGGSRRGGGSTRRDEAEANNKMPLTAHLDVAPLQKSTTGWKASSIGQPMAAGPDPSGNMAPDMVQRKVKAALNKMTPEKFDKIADQILDIAAQSKNESDGRTLRQVIQLTFEKACDEAHWAGMYAQFCQKMLLTMSNDVRDETIKDRNGQPVVGGALFRKYLLNRCQEEFERGWQVNLPDKPEGEEQEVALLSDEYYVAAAAKRRGLGLIQFIGQLYRLKMLTLRIMHECVLRLLNFEGDPDEAAVENLTTLLRAVGPTMDDDEQGHNFMGAYFSRIEDTLLKSDKLPSRPKFMIMDLMDLRKAGWKGKDDSKGPKTIQQIHAEAEAAQVRAEAERQRASQRGPPGGRPPVGRGDARNFSSGAMQPPVDYNRTTVNMDDMRRLQNRAAPRQTGGGLGPGGSLGPGSLLAPRSGSRRGAGPLGGASSGNTTRTNTPPVDSKDKKEEPSAQQNAFSALASLDTSGEAPEDADTATSPPTTRARSKSPSADDKAEE